MIVGILSIVIPSVVAIGIAIFQCKKQIRIDTTKFIQQYRIGEDEHKAEISLLPL